MLARLHCSILLALLGLSLFSGYAQLALYYLSGLPAVIVPMIRDVLFIATLGFSLALAVRSKRMLKELWHLPLFVALVLPSLYDSNFSAQAIRNLFGPLILAIILVPIGKNAYVSDRCIELVYKAFHLYLLFIALEFFLVFFLNVDTVAYLAPLLEQKNSKVNYSGGILSAVRVATPHLSPSTGGVAAAGILLLIMQNRLRRGFKGTLFKLFVPLFIMIATVGKSIPFAYLYLAKRPTKRQVMLGVIAIGLVCILLLGLGNMPAVQHFDFAIHMASLGQHMTGLTSGLSSIASHPFGNGIGKVCIVGINATGLDRELGNESGIGCLAASSGIAGIYSLVILFAVMMRRKLFALLLFVTVVMLFNENALAPYVLFPILLAGVLIHAYNNREHETDEDRKIVMS